MFIQLGSLHWEEEKLYRRIGIIWKMIVWHLSWLFSVNMIRRYFRFSLLKILGFIFCCRLSYSSIKLIGFVKRQKWLELFRCLIMCLKLIDSSVFHLPSTILFISTFTNKNFKFKKKANSVSGKCRWFPTQTCRTPKEET